jgi:hypothetical protein
MRGLSRKVLFLIVPLILTIACSAVNYLSDDLSPLDRGVEVDDAQLTPIELPARWTITPTLSPMPTSMRTATPTPTPTYSLEAVSTPYALETLGPDFTLVDASIKPSDLPAGFTSLSMEELMEEMFSGFFGEGSDMEALMPEDMQMDEMEMDFSNSMNFTMLLNEAQGTTITSAAFLFSTEAEQNEFDQELEQELDEFPEDVFPPDSAEVLTISVFADYGEVGDVSQAVQFNLVAPDENGVEQEVSIGMVNFRRGPVGAMLMVMQMEAGTQIDMKNLAALLDQRITAALDDVSYPR